MAEVNARLVKLIRDGTSTCCDDSAFEGGRTSRG